MENEIALSQEDEDFLDSLFKESEYVCASCYTQADVDEDQTHTYCEFCEAFTEVIERDKAR